MLRALIWDVDGTLAETERDGHRVAFNAAFEAADLPWRWDVGRYGELLKVTGGYERLLADMDTRADAPADADQRKALARRLHHLKNDRYHALVHERRIALRPGVERVLDECARSAIVLGIATTTGRANVEALLAATLGDRGIERFRAIVCAEDAPAKKPDPLAYRIALDRLGIDAGDALAIEDSPNGLVAARALGIGTVVTRSAYFLDADFSGCAAICDDLDTGERRPGQPTSRVDVAALRDIHRRSTACTQ